MCARRTFLLGPRYAAVSGGDEAAITAGGPSSHRIARRKRHRVQVIFDRALNLDPSLAAIRCS